MNERTYLNETKEYYVRKFLNEKKERQSRGWSRQVEGSEITDRGALRLRVDKKKSKTTLTSHSNLLKRPAANGLIGVMGGSNPSLTPHLHLTHPLTRLFLTRRNVKTEKIMKIFGENSCKRQENFVPLQSYF